MTGLGDLEKNPVNHQAARIVAKVVWLVRCRDEDVPRHERVFFFEGVEDEIPFEAKAKLHAARMIMKVGALSNGEEVAESENRNAVDAILPQVKDPITGFVTIGYLVGYHRANIIANNLMPIGYKKIIERIMLTCSKDSV